MKQYISRFLKTTSLFYMAFPIAYILLCAMLFDIPAWGCLRVLFSPWYLVLSGLAIAVGYGFWEMKRWAWYLFVTVNILIIYQNAVMVNDYGETHHKALTFAFSLFLVALVTYRVAREIRVPYFFPKIRWWESDPRYRLSVPVGIQGSGSTTPIDGNILDLSMGGCFIKLRSELPQDEKVVLNFTVFQIKIRCEGTVVWRTQSTVTHPKGVGVKFLELDRVSRRSLRLVHRRLKHISTLYRRSRYLLNQEAFVKRLQELESKPFLNPKRRREKVG